MKQYEKILKALANKRRLEIIKYLKNNKEATVGDLADKIKVSIKATSKHLAILANAGVLEREHRSSFILYSLSRELEPVAKAVVVLV